MHFNIKSLPSAAGQVLVKVGQHFVPRDPSVLTPAGHFNPAADNLYDLGDATTPRWRRLHLAGYAVAPTIGPSAAQQHALPAVASDTLVLLAAAQTLTNKTLTSPAYGSGSSTETAGVQTTDATVTTVYSKTLSDNTAYALSITVAARRTDAAARARYRREVLVFREAAGAATLQGDVVVPVPDQESVAAWDVAVDVSGNDVRVRVTGAGGATINWRARVEITAAA